MSPVNKMGSRSLLTWSPGLKEFALHGASRWCTAEIQRSFCNMFGHIRALASNSGASQWYWVDL